MLQDKHECVSAVNMAVVYKRDKKKNCDDRQNISVPQEKDEPFTDKNRKHYVFCSHMEKKTEMKNILFRCC